MRKFLAVLCVFALLFQPISAAAVAPELVFYDIAQDTYTTVYQIENMGTSFVTSDAVYFADYTSKKESTSDAAEGSTVNIYNMTVQMAKGAYTLQLQIMNSTCLTVRVRF